MHKHELIVNNAERFGADDVKVLKADGRERFQQGAQVRIVELATGKALMPIRRGAAVRWVAIDG